LKIDFHAPRNFVVNILPCICYNASMVTIAFTGGGTGGHIYPALAVAAELGRLFAGRDFKLFWIGSNAGMDRSLVEKAGIEFYGVPSGRLRRYFSLKTIPDFFKVIAGFFAARKILKKRKASLLFSKGGFVSVPPCAAAAALGIPVFTHESDFSPGLATKINARFALRTGGAVFTAYEDTARFFPPAVRDCVKVSGNPVRNAFRNADAAKGRAFLGLGSDVRILLVVGGSQGAREINEMIFAILPELAQFYTVAHQTGASQTNVPPPADHYKPFPYIGEEIPHVMAAAEMIIGRSGAGTLWECAVLGKPMLLVPLSGSGTRGDQVENAAFFQKSGAAVVFNEGDKAQALKRAVALLAQNAAEREKMAKAARQIGEREGAGYIARFLEERIKLTAEL
jgi:UDP-N-acetylglucosamine--N-acetylmuramyl-(pentapeptide) pyrophosphoryl-undecaprenol N-acetylglucosamine transferase